MTAPARMKTIPIPPGAPVGRTFRELERRRYAGIARRLDSERRHWRRVRDDAAARIADIDRTATAVADAVRRLDAADAAEAGR